MPAWLVARRAISATMSSSDEYGMSAPRAAASSTAIVQSGQQTPGATTFWPSRVMRPSRLVVVPARSPQIAAGQDDVAYWIDSLRNESTATTKPAAASARRASFLSGRSAAGSAPRRTRPCSRPSPATRTCPRRRGPVRRAPDPRRRRTRRGRPRALTRPGQHTRCEAHVERAVHVRPAKRRQERGVGPGVAEGGDRLRR